MNKTQEQPTNINLTVTRNGELDKEYARTARINGFRDSLAHIAGVVLEKAGEGLQAVVTPLALDIADHRYGSTLRDEYFAKKRQVASDEIRKIVQL